MCGDAWSESRASRWPRQHERPVTLTTNNPITDPGRRHTTLYRGLSYRARADGSRRYSVYFRGRYIGVDGGEQDALAKQAELRGKAARGERVVTPTMVTFAE